MTFHDLTHTKQLQICSNLQLSTKPHSALYSSPSLHREMLLILDSINEGKSILDAISCWSFIPTSDVPVCLDGIFCVITSVSAKPPTSNNDRSIPLIKESVGYFCATWWIISFSWEISSQPAKFFRVLPKVFLIN